MPKSATLNRPLVTVVLTQDKETKGAVRYSDDTEGSVLPTLYVRKDAFPDGNFPATITVTVS